MHLTSPAKLNLHLHILGQENSGYHLLDSLVVFTNFGDTLTLESSAKFELEIRGTFAKKLQKHTPSTENLIEKSVMIFSALTNTKPNYKITLEKNIPLGAGLGGGSSNAATTLKALQQFYQTQIDLSQITSKLGSDITAFLNVPTPIIIRETGNEIIIPHFNIPTCYILMVNAGQHCSTPEIYKNLEMKEFSSATEFPHQFKTTKEFTDFLNKETRNDLTDPALKLKPNISRTLEAIASQKSCLLARMTGSGATCFGIFETITHAQTAAQEIKTTHPEWWVVQSTTL